MDVDFTVIRWEKRGFKQRFSFLSSSLFPFPVYYNGTCEDRNIEDSIVTFDVDYSGSGCLCFLKAIVFLPSPVVGADPTLPPNFSCRRTTTYMNSVGGRAGG